MVKRHVEHSYKSFIRQQIQWARCYVQQCAGTYVCETEKHINREIYYSRNSLVLRQSSLH
jgi:hypothetical protein